MKNLEELITILDKGKYPTRSDCSFFVNQVFSGKVDKDIITRILKLFNKVGYTSEQLVGFATSMRQASKRVDCKKTVLITVEQVEMLCILLIYLQQHP